MISVKAISKNQKYFYEKNVKIKNLSVSKIKYFNQIQDVLTFTIILSSFLSGFFGDLVVWIFFYNSLPDLV